MALSPRDNVPFVDYQDQGIPGRAIQTRGAPGGCVDLDGKRYDIAAQVHTMGCYSVPADQKDLAGFVTRMRKWPSDAGIVHGTSMSRKGNCWESLPHEVLWVRCPDGVVL